MKYQKSRLGLINRVQAWNFTDVAYIKFTLHYKS